MDTSTIHHAGIAAVLSFIFNGLGQIYNGEIKKGLFIMSASSFCLIIIILGGIILLHWLLTQSLSINELILGSSIFLLGILGACWLGVYSITDAYQKAAR